MAKAPIVMHQNGNWYTNIYDPTTGRRIRISTHTKDPEKAMQVYAAELEKLSYLQGMKTLKEIFILYQNTETNPRYQQYQIEGRSYSFSYARQITYVAKHLEEILELDGPKLLHKLMKDITRNDVKKIRDAIIREYGVSRTAQFHFRSLKAMFSQAQEDCIIENNPCDGLRGISYKEEKRNAYPEEILSTMIARKELWPDEEHWAFFSVLATTGLRRCEALALSPSQILKGTLTVDRQLGTRKNETLPPKWGVIRVIPLSKITLRILNGLTVKQERFFCHGKSWVDAVFYSARAVANVLFPNQEGLQEITAHTLRHSLHSNILINGANQVLAAEYLSWKHQDLMDTQKRYTHVYAKKLIVIADLIDVLYGSDKNFTMS